MLKAEGPNLYHLSDEALKDRILTILQGMCSEDGDLTEVPTISQSVLNFLIEHDPGRRDFFGNINNWVNTVQNSETSVSPTINNKLFEKMDEQLDIINLIIEDIKSHFTSNLIIAQNEAALRISKVGEIIKIIESKYPGISLDPFFKTGFIENILADYSTEQLLSSSITSEVISLINSDIILYLSSNGMF